MLGIRDHPRTDPEDELRIDLQMRVILGEVLLVDTDEDVLLFLGVDELDIPSLDELLELGVALGE